MVTQASISTSGAPPELRALGLAGPTASGKTALALALAQKLPLEIISMDSALVFQEMDLGTAKPSPAELAAVPHHLIDILRPDQAYSAAQFVRDATRLINEINQRGKLALIVGGTMLYWKALTQGLSELPTTPPALREQVNARALQEGWPAMHAALLQLDPATAARLQPNDAQRIGRALEVVWGSGKTLSQWIAESARLAQDLPRLEIPLVSLEPENRAWLHDGIGQRFSQMLQQGLVEEATTLWERYPNTALPALRCVGYRQVIDSLRGLEPWDTLADRGCAATRQLAKRQLTWLRSLPKMLVFACDKLDTLGMRSALLKHLSL